MRLHSDGDKKKERKPRQDQQKIYVAPRAELGLRVDMTGRGGIGEKVVI
jgi:hypothetical protein